MNEILNLIKSLSWVSGKQEFMECRQQQEAPINESDDHREFFTRTFDDASEQLFWKEGHDKILSTLKIALLLGALGFLAFILLDICIGDLSNLELVGRIMIVPMLFALLLYLHLHPQPTQKISTIAKLGAGLSVANLLVILLIDGNPVFYPETWVGLLPIYFFTYGQMFMTIADTVIFGLLAMIALPLCGYLIGVDSIALLPSIMILLIVNTFGFCTRRQLESYARNMFKERRNAEFAAEDKTLFLRDLSHNLRQPLQALSCYTSVLDAAFGDRQDEHAHHVISKLGLAVDELNHAFNHILDIANLETGKQIPLLTTVDINVLLATLENQFAQLAAKRGLKLKVKLRYAPPYTIYSDACILSQIVGNLIDNALKYTSQGWVLVEAVRIGGNRLKLHVCDTGIGIHDRQKPYIFNEFYRGHRRSKDPRIQGLGIGLTYVRKAVNHLPEHSLDFYSRPNLGSDFQLFMPIAGEKANPACPHNRYESELTGSFVFVVDDDRQVLDALVEQLSCWGCIVQKAASTAETLVALADNFRPPDLLITDFYLSDNETAHDIIAAIEADCGSVPTLILSAHAIPAEDKAKWPKNTLLLRKPANASVLMNLMAKAMGK